MTLSGLDPAADHQASAINLDTHIADVLELITVEDLAEVILCTHSYGGMVATGVANRAQERVAALIYLDAFVPENGQSWWELAGERYRTLAVERARHDGLSVLPPDGLDPRCRPHPLGSFLQALRLGESVVPARRVFVYASGWEAHPIRGAASEAAVRRGLDRTQHRLRPRCHQHRARRSLRDLDGSGARLRKLTTRVR